MKNGNLERPTNTCPCHRSKRRSNNIKQQSFIHCEITKQPRYNISDTKTWKRIHMYMRTLSTDADLYPCHCREIQDRLPTITQRPHAEQTNLRPLQKQQCQYKTGNVTTKAESLTAISVKIVDTDSLTIRDSRRNGQTLKRLHLLLISITVVFLSVR